MNKPCPTRDKILQFIILFREEHGFGPSIREIARAVGVSAPSTVAHHLTWLEDHGMISRSQYKFRSLVATQNSLPISAVL